MAELILSPIAASIIKSLGSAAVQEIATFWGVSEELKELQDTISIIEGVLRDAEKKQVHKSGVRLWLRSLGDAVHDAGDLVDEFDTEALRRELMNGNEVAKKVRTFFSASNQLAFRYKMGQRIRDIKEKLAKASKDQIFLLLEARFPEEESEVVRRRETHSYVPQEEVIGRDEERDAIVKLLIESRFEENVPVIPIVGMGGLGKTTLAQSAFNYGRVQQHFELKIWVCVSEFFDVKAIARIITDSKVIELDQLQKDVRTKLSGKRYLLVLDDVWEEKRENWLKLGNLLSCGAEGSRVVVTTRSIVVASITSTLDPYRLGVLDEEKSWSLFEKMAFRQGQQERNPNLVEIGKKIVERCRGIPLAIRAIGNTLYCKQSESQWSSFDKEFSKLPQEDTIFPTLKLSYDNLASQLKHCFAYCRLFPKDHRIKVQMLIQLWMAQGFVKLSDPCDDQCLEDVGYQYYLDLLERSFFQEIKLDSFGVVESCKMHDLIHDLAIEVAGEEFATGNWKSKETISENVRHLSFLGYGIVSPSQIMPSFGQTRKIRTLLSLDNCLHFCEPKPIWDGILSNLMIRTLGLSYFKNTRVPKNISGLKHLRYLDLSWNSELKNLPNSISNLLNLQTLKVNNCYKLKELPRDISGLKHLRYLDLSSNWELKNLPNSISNLLNLQTLKLNHCRKLEELPRDMKKLVNLRHLELDGCDKLRYMPVGFSQLTKLTTLSRYVLPSSSDSPPVGCGGELRELAGFNNLRGELTISNLRPKEADIRAFYLKEKKHLQTLALEWDPSAANIDGCEMLVESLQPHKNLQTLRIYYDTSVNLPSWLPSLTNLTELYINLCKNYEHLFPISELHNLRTLMLSNLPSLEYIWDISGINNNLSHSLQNLQLVELYSLPNLKGWFKDNPHQPLPSFPRLIYLDIDDCPSLMWMPLYPHVQAARLSSTSLEPFRKTILESTPTSLSNIEYLWISNPTGDNVECLPEWFKNLSSLQYLEIKRLDQLKDLCPGILYLTSLQELQIQGCMGLDLSDVDETTWRSLNGRLQILKLFEFTKLEALPEGIRHVTSLQELSVRGCDVLAIIPEWISDLTSLKRLEFYGCPQLTELPESIRSLTSLRFLGISGCPVLSKRCQRTIGEEWPKIADIPYVYLYPDPNDEDNVAGSSEAPKKTRKLFKNFLSR